MEPNTNNSSGLRILRNALPAALLAGALTACGGGGGGGGNEPPPPQPCASQNSQGDGFALGSCAATLTNVFQPIDSSVQVGAGTSSYTLSLTFPAALSGLSGATALTVNNQPPGSERNIIGVLRGQAYEEPLRTTLVPPYVALTDFFQAWDYQQDTTAPRLLSLTYASFGTWEKFAGSGSAAFNEGYLGTWFAARPASTQNDGPSAAATYSGFVVGVIGPDGSSSAPALIGRFGFSGPITINGSGTGITSGSIGSLTVSFQTSTSPNLTVTQLDIKEIDFAASVGTPPAAMTGALSTDAAGTGTNLTQGTYEARYFGAPGNIGREVAGRIRFKTSNGLIGVGSFGARRP